MMPDEGDRGKAGALQARTIGSINDVATQDWNALAAPDAATANPFITHEFLSALEQSGSVSTDAGWSPAHILLEDDASIVAVAPVYFKWHSFGEYVFDHHWADAFERVGGRYYPKVLCAPPFTPVPGPRLLARSSQYKSAISNALINLTRSAEASSAHVNFISEEDRDCLRSRGFLIRTGRQYHWFNRGYQNFEDFLSTLTSRKRKAVRRERRDAVAGTNIKRLSGADITEASLDAFWRFYQDTGARKWGRPYLTRDFFSLVAQSMRDNMLLIFAEESGRPLAGALNFIGGEALYGRYWGRIEDRPFLHFELCYHQAVEFAIERGLSRVEAGAQGEHKIARGYEPVITYSAHWIENQQLRRAVERALMAERTHVAAETAALEKYTPYKRDEPR